MEKERRKIMEKYIREFNISGNISKSPYVQFTEEAELEALEYTLRASQFFVAQELLRQETNNFIKSSVPSCFDCSNNTPGRP